MERGYIGLREDLLTSNEISVIKLMKNPKHLNLFLLIALRTQTHKYHPIDNIKIGEAIIGKYENIGLNKKDIKSSLMFLKSYGYITFETTEIGIIVKILDTRIVDVNFELKQGDE